MPVLSASLPTEVLIEAYRLMYLSRRLDDREILLKRQNRIYFQVSGAGHEAIQIAAGLAIAPGEDWVYPYYRDRALCLTLGMTTEAILLQAVGAGADPSSGGRQMPSHWSSPELRIVSASSPTGTQYLQAAGCAQASRILNPGAREIALVTSGEGATSEGEFWEALNIACLEKLPLIFLIQDNGFAISVPIEEQTAGGSITRLAAGFPDLLTLDVDGTDLVASFNTMQRAVEYARAGEGPALVRATCIRPYSHSLSDDEKLYKTEAERQSEAARDPLNRFPEWLVEEGLLDRHRLQLITHEVDEELQAATDAALRAVPPEAGSALRFLYSESVDPTGPDFDSEPQFTGDHRTMVDEINLTIDEELTRDARVIVFGEDVADCGAPRESGASERQRRRLQSHPGPATASRLRALFQYPDCRSRHRRARHRYGDARTEARGRDPVLRLHLAGDDADPR
jgi:2-oxoisovalerate dehydrogenase E1 component